MCFLCGVMDLVLVVHSFAKTSETLVLSVYDSSDEQCSQSGRTYHFRSLLFSFWTRWPLFA